MDKVTILSVICGLAFGIVIALINSNISIKFAKSDNVQMLMAGNVVRFLIDVAAIGGGYLVCKHFGFSLIPVLISIVVGISLFGMIFLRIITKKF